MAIRIKRELIRNISPGYAFSFEVKTKKIRFMEPRETLLQVGNYYFATTYLCLRALCFYVSMCSARAITFP